MLWILLACVPLIDVVSMAAVQRTHWGPRPQWPLEANDEWWSTEPRAGRPRDFEVPQQFPPWQPKLPWKYPEPPAEPDREVPDDVQLVTPVMVPHLAMKCGINTIKVEVMQDLWGNGNLLQEGDLTLGGCSFTEFDHSANVIVFESKLELCGSEKSVWPFCFCLLFSKCQPLKCVFFFVFLQMTNNFITYTFVLEHRPKISVRIPIRRTQNTNIVMQCHYPRQVMSKQATLQTQDEEPVMP